MRCVDHTTIDRCNLAINSLQPSTITGGTTCVSVQILAATCTAWALLHCACEACMKLLECVFLKHSTADTDQTAELKTSRRRGRSRGCTCSPDAVLSFRRTKPSPLTQPSSSYAHDAACKLAPCLVAQAIQSAAGCAVVPHLSRLPFLRRATGAMSACHLFSMYRLCNNKPIRCSTSYISALQQKRSAQHPVAGEVPRFPTRASSLRKRHRLFTQHGTT